MPFFMYVLNNILIYIYCGQRKKEVCVYVGVCVREDAYIMPTGVDCRCVQRTDKNMVMTLKCIEIRTKVVFGSTYIVCREEYISVYSDHSVKLTTNMYLNTNVYLFNTQFHLIFLTIWNSRQCM